MCSSPSWGYIDGAGMHFCGSFACFDDVASLFAEIKRTRSANARFVLIPCGKCLSCRMASARDWSFRCECELQTYGGQASFLTLTYNDQHLPYDSQGRPCLCKDDYQRFLKRLRKSLDGTRISYFGCGEYGSKSLRPHYHFILFGFVPDDLYHFGMSPKGYPILRSSKVENLWTDDKDKSIGYSTFGLVEPQSIDYVCRYSLKKAGIDYSAYEVKPFTACSRRPSIGLTWWRKYGSSLVRTSADGDVFRAEVIHRGSRMPLPRFFLKHAFHDDTFPLDLSKGLSVFRREKMLENFRQRGLDILSDRPIVCDDLSTARYMLSVESSPAL